MLTGRMAGRKGVIVKTFEDGSKVNNILSPSHFVSQDRKFGHCLVAGIDRHPRKITKAMNRKKIEKRTKVVPFLKFTNFNHIMPTRYALGSGEMDLKKVFDTGKEAAAKEKKEEKEKVEDPMTDPGARSSIKKEIKKVFEDKYRNLVPVKTSKDRAAQLRFLFKRLRF